MQKGYWIGRIDVEDPAAYIRYREANREAFDRFGARFLVRGGDFVSVEGESRLRNVVIEFESYATALACYRSPEYQRAREIRQAGSVGELIIIQGHAPDELEG